MSRKISLVIIDDEEPARAVIKSYLNDYPHIEIKAECSNGFEGLKAIQDFQPDIVFLDIQMPKINGFEMLELLEESPVIVFSTAYDEYAFKAFEASAADYLLKPYSPERFAEAMNRALTFVNEKQPGKKVIKKILHHREGEPEYLERIVAKSSSTIFVIPVEELNWLEAQGDYVMLHSKQGKLLKQKTMKYFDDHLNPKDFVRIHRSYIVRISIIKKIEQLGKEAYQVILTNGKNLPVSKSGHTRLKQFFS